MTGGPLTAQNDTTTRESTDQDSTYKSAHVTDGVSGALKSREMAAAVVHPGADVAGENTNGRTWTEAENVKKIFVTANGSGAVTDNQDYVDIILDAPNGTIAKALLDEVIASNSVDQAFVRIRIPFGERIELPTSGTKTEGSPIRRIDVNPTQAANISVEAY